MKTYYVVPCDFTAATPLLSSAGAAVHVLHSLSAAKEAADQLHAENGKHYHVIKIETVWTTTTLAELIKEEEGL